MVYKKNTFLVTGAAGFIGAALAIKLIKEGITVVGIDNLNDYYDPVLKESRLKLIQTKANHVEGSFKFYKCSLEDKASLKKIFSLENPSIVVNLAAQAGVRYSLENPEAYFQSNLMGFCNLLEVVKENDIENFIFASSSSVYGGNKVTPFREDQKIDYPVSLYAATKKSNEILAYSYSHLYKIPTTGLRFFTVYGPWGRPDMAPMLFIKSILNNQPIKVFNKGDMRRDFTYIDDITEGIFRCCLKPASADGDIDSNLAPYRIFNIGNGKPIELMEFIQILEKKLNKNAIKEFLPMQKGDVVETFADTQNLIKWINYKPQIDIEEGLDKFVEWYKYYHD